jgi:hypothetical protein
MSAGREIVTGGGGIDMCICGHPEREHDRTGECRAAGCRCKHFKPEIGLPSRSGEAP